MRTVQIVLVLATAIAPAAVIAAENYPKRPVRVVVPVSPGSGLDVSTRVVTQKLSETWAQPVVVDNRTGAGTTLGTALVAKASSDGYTLLVNSAAFTQTPALYTSLPYDIRNHFVGVTPLVSSPYLLVVGPSLGAKSVGELIAAAKSKPGQLHYGSAGVGTATHMAAEKFRLAAGINGTHVPYKGAPEAMVDVMTGRVAFLFPPIGIALAHVREGRFLALAVTSGKRSNLLPEVPTMAESGVNGFEDKIWFGMWAPAGTPEYVLEKIATDVARIYEAQDVRSRLASLAFEPLRMTRKEYADFVESEIATASRVIKATGIKLQ
ncbi:MAG: tripartite tricarboxylate transporter substrate binding protein [Betaproteobacteria bacterium]